MARSLKISIGKLLAPLLVFSVVFGFSLVSTAQAWDDCPRGEVDCVYPGECSRYIDTNGDGICDHSQSEPAAPTTTDSIAGSAVDTAAAAAALVSAAGADTTSTTTPSGGTGSSDDTVNEVADAGSANIAGVSGVDGETAVTTAATDGSSSYSFLTHYYISPIAIGFFLIYAVSFVLYKTKRMRAATHRKIWNVLLLLTFLITGVFGLLLAIQLDYTLPFTIPVDMLFWHVEAGIVMTLISLFHMGWHFNYYKNLLRSSRAKARAAEAAERRRPVRPAEQKYMAPVPQRVKSTDDRRPAWDTRD